MSIDLLLISLCFFFFSSRRRHRRFKCDWSSDVCSSDLGPARAGPEGIQVLVRDFFVHQYLNAFRPGSRWAAADSAEERDRFQHLPDPLYAFERITGATVMGRALRPDYPYAPDSTIAHWTLPQPLAPGDSLVVEIDWQPRLSTVPRRQCLGDANASASAPSRCTTSRSRSIHSTSMRRAATGPRSCGCCMSRAIAPRGGGVSRWATPSWRSPGSIRCTAPTNGRNSRTCTASRAGGPSSR